MDNENLESEEEILVYAEFEDSVNIDKYRAIHILGADEKHPIIQLDETFFMGKYENALGTYMFFEQDSEVQGKDPLFDKYPEKILKYVSKTGKLISMENAYVTPKEGKETNLQSQTKETEEDVQPVIFQDVEQATEAFKAYFMSDPVPNKSTDQQNIYITRTEPASQQNMENIDNDSIDNQMESNNITPI